MLTHNYSQIRKIRVRDVCLIFVSLQNNVWVRMFYYQSKIHLGNLREFGQNQYQVDSVQLLVTFFPHRNMNLKFGKQRRDEKLYRV